MHWSGGASWNDVWDELGMGEMGDWMGWLFSGGAGGQRWMEQSAAGGVQQRAGVVVPRRPEWIWDERFRRWVRAPPPMVRNVAPVTCKYKKKIVVKASF